jgi:Flp pilus assembly protein TadD
MPAYFATPSWKPWRHYEEAVAEARKVTEMNPNYFPAHVCLGLAYEQIHEFSSAVAELQKAAGFAGRNVTD